VGVALPELPDDRRASPRTQPPAERPVSVRNRDALPPDWPVTGSPARPPAEAVGSGPGQRGGKPGAGQFPPANGIPRPGGPVSGPVGGPPTSAGPAGRQQPPTDATRANGAGRSAPEQNGGGARGVPPSAPVANGRPPAPLQQYRPAPPGPDDPGTEPIGPTTGPTDALPIEPPAARRAPVRPDAADSTVEIGRALPAPDEATASDPAGTAALAEGARISRRERREAGELGGRAGSDYKKQHDQLSKETRKKPRSGRRRRPAFWRELPLLVVVALLLTFLIQTFLAKVYVIPSGSMETTLHGCTGCNNDRVLVDKITYRFSAPERGDVVVFRGPDSWSSEVTVDPPSNWVAAGLQQLGSLIGIAPPDEKDFVKRVIGVGGDVVQCCDTRNRVMVNGQPIDEPYVYYLPEAGPPRQDPFGPITVPDGELWMMGDSRNNSSDSRVPGHGPIPVANVIGKARLIVLPVNRFGWITSFDPTKTTAVGLAPDAGPPLALGALFAVPLLRRRRTTLQRRDERLDGLDGFLADRGRWR
jgi:signal peptidase I